MGQEQWELAGPKGKLAVASQRRCFPVGIKPVEGYACRGALMLAKR